MNLAETESGQKHLRVEWTFVESKQKWPSAFTDVLTDALERHDFGLDERVKQGDKRSWRLMKMIAVELRRYIRLRPGESWTEENGRKWEAKVRYKINRLVDNSVLKSRAKSRAKQELARERDNRAQGNCTAPESRLEIEDMVNMKPCENEQEEFAKMKRWYRELHHEEAEYVNTGRDGRPDGAVDARDIRKRALIGKIVILNETFPF